MAIQADSLTERVTPSQISLRLPNERDAAFIQELTGRAGSPLLGARVIEVGGVRVGLAILFRERAKIVIETIRILPEYDGRGIGGHVLAAILEDAKAENLIVILPRPKLGQIKPMKTKLPQTASSASHEPEIEEGVEVDFSLLEPSTLEQLIKAFVLREGTDYGEVEVSLEAKMTSIRRQLEKRELKIVFDLNSQSGSIVPQR